MQNFTFEFCALYYLNQWLKNDRAYRSAILKKSPSLVLRGIADAASFYGIARNLPTKFDVKAGKQRYEPLLPILNSKPSNKLTNATVLQFVSNVREAISAQYGDQGTLSAATKLLWLMYRTPVIIYDSQARDALGTRAGDLETYYACWRSAFRSHTKAIAAACLVLPGASAYCIDPWTATPAYIERHASQRWFQERVFDVYLWHMGGAKLSVPC
jgi:hypothetical protein